MLRSAVNGKVGGGERVKNTSCGIRIGVCMQLELHFLDEVRDVRPVDAFDADRPGVSVVYGHSPGASIGVDWDCDVSVDYRPEDANSLDAFRI